MDCENLQFNLPLYIDDILSDDERMSIEDHLPTCPLCRQKLSDYKHVTNSLRMISRHTIPADLLHSVRSAVANEINLPTINLGIEKRETITDKLAHWLMPYSLGTVAASIFTFIFFSIVISTSDISNNNVAINDTKESSILLANATPDKVRDKLAISPEYESMVIGDYQPEVNPTGALVALTKSIVRGKMKDEEVVVVADVFGNGIAHITEVVEPPSDDRAMLELQKAFQTDPEDAPFLPAKFNGNSDSVRVILKIQRVDVVDLRPNKRK